MKTKTYRPGDQDWMFSADGITLTPRATIEIGVGCPTSWRSIIAEAYNNGWLKPVAHIPVHEHFMEELNK